MDQCAEHFDIFGRKERKNIPALPAASEPSRIVLIPSHLRVSSSPPAALGPRLSSVCRRSERHRRSVSEHVLATSLTMALTSSPESNGSAIGAQGVNLELSKNWWSCPRRASTGACTSKRRDADTQPYPRDRTSRRVLILHRIHSPALDYKTSQTSHGYPHKKSLLLKTSRTSHPHRATRFPSNGNSSSQQAGSHLIPQISSSSILIYL